MLEKGFSVPELLLLALPAPVSWFPLPVGWIVLAIIILLLSALYLFVRLARWRRNRWRREALSVLPDLDTVDVLFALIKRVLLVHQVRAQISNTTSPQMILQSITLDDDLRRIMCLQYCHQENRLDANQAARLRGQLAHWLKELPDV